MNKKKLTFLVFAVIFISSSFYLWQVFFTPNFEVKEEGEFIYIPENATYKVVLDSLRKRKIIRDEISFLLVAKWLKYSKLVKSGRYLIKPSMGNHALIQKLRKGEQTPIRITFNNIRTKADLLLKIGNQFSFSSEQLASALNNPQIQAKYGCTDETILSIFRPNTYEIFWNTSPERFLERMNKEYQKFWTSAALEKAKEIHLSPTEVIVLASIVEGETQKNDEKSRIAGVYLNRLERNIPLQADPTLVFAIGDFSIRRVLERHIKTDSPYNTYLHKGLPPGPINLPSNASVEAVLNHEKHNYIYFCAKEDFSGYHNFAEKYEEHLGNARKYQKALSIKKIY